MPPDSTPIDQVDPAAASALHRLLVVHRIQPNLPASIDLRAFDGIEVCGPEEQARSLARAIVCSAAAFHSPSQLIVAVLCSEQNLAHWDWVKWLPHAQSAEQSDAVGPSRMVTTSLADLPTLLPPDLSDRPRFGADERPATPHILLVIDGGHLPPGNHVIPPDGLHGVTLLDLPSRWDQLDDASRLRLEIDDPEVDPTAAARTAAGADKVAIQALRVREDPVAGARRPVRPRHGRGVRPPAHAAAHRLRPGSGTPTSPPEITGPGTSWTSSGSATCTTSTRRRRGGRDPLATACGCRSAWVRAAAWSTSTSRSRPSRAWARTASSSAPPGPASRSSSAPWCSVWR